MKVAARVVVELCLSFAASSVSASAQTRCSLTPGVALFRQVAGAEVVGECKEPASFAESGDITQATTKGLAVFRYADQTIAFTDGQTTWLYGPEGLQSRPIGDRFAWERQQTPPPPVTGAGSITPSPTMTLAPPVAVVPQPVNGVDLNSQCARIARTEWAPYGSRLGANPGNLLSRAIEQSQMECVDTGIQYGQRGVDCYERALHQGLELGMRPGASSGLSALIREELAACIGGI